MKFTFVLLIVALAVPGSSQDFIQSALSKPPSKFKLFQHHSTVAWSCTSSGVNAFVYKAGMAVDADGAFRAYHPNNRLGLDSIEHAGRPGHWWALATDTGKTTGHPIVQRKGDPAPGYYVSMTSLFDDRHSERDPRRFVDAAKIPYVVLPPIGSRHAKLGDFATVINLRNRKMAGAIVADESSSDLKMGEGSIALAKALGIHSSPRNGGIDDGVAYLIYPGSGNAKPRRLKEIVAISRTHFQTWGGRDKLNAFLRTEPETTPVTARSEETLRPQEQPLEK